MRPTTFAIASLLGLTLALPARPAEPPSNAVYELRTYTTAPGKLSVLLERFGKSNLPLFQKHGIQLIGAWTPTSPDEHGERLIYLVSFPSRDAAKKAWAAFSSDPDWQATFGKEKEEHGTVVTRVENLFLAPTSYSPVPQPTSSLHVYELRNYTASPGRLDKLNTRFQDHTLKLFEKHGMSNVLYTTPTDEDHGASDTLIYLLAHLNADAERASWQAFRDDPEWQAARAESENDGVKLASKVVSLNLTPTTFSPLQ